MIYILIVMWAGFSQSTAGKTSLAVEFNTLEACQATQEAIRKQNSPSVALCAEKGRK